MTGPAGSPLLTPGEIRRIAAELDLRPAKTRGQNFVVDPNTIRRIVATAGLTGDEVVIEVGPGLGSLTLALLPAAAAVVAIEVDPRLARRLPRTVAEHLPGPVAGRLSVIEADALRLGREEVIRAAGADPGVLVANLPYNVAVPILLHLLAELPTLSRALVMVQAEVAARLTAAPGSRSYGAPTVKLAWWGRVRAAGAVPRSVFWPVPRVDSALVAWRRDTDRPVVPAVGRGAVFAVVDAAFGQRRKTLRAALAGWAGTAAAAEAVLRRAGIDPAVRAEQLTVDDFTRIAAAAGRGSAIPSPS